MKERTIVSVVNSSTSVAIPSISTHQTCPTCRGEGKVTDSVVKAIEEKARRKEARREAFDRWNKRVASIALCIVSFPTALAVVRGMLTLYAWMTGTRITEGEKCRDSYGGWRCNPDEMTTGNQMLMVIAFTSGLVLLGFFIAQAIDVWKGTRRRAK